MIKAEDSWRHSELNEHHFSCDCGKRVYFDDSELKGKKTIITCPNCGEKNRIYIFKVGRKRMSKEMDGGNGTK